MSLGVLHILDPCWFCSMTASSRGSGLLSLRGKTRRFTLRCRDSAQLHGRFKNWIIHLKALLSFNHGKKRRENEVAQKTLVEKYSQINICNPHPPKLHSRRLKKKKLSHCKHCSLNCKLKLAPTQAILREPDNVMSERSATVSLMSVWSQGELPTVYQGNFSRVLYLIIQ